MLIQEEPEFAELEDPLFKCCQLKQRELIMEAVGEYCRRGNFVRIFPSKNSHMYDSFFAGTRPINRILYKVLFGDKILKFKKNLSNVSIPQTLQI